jgi:hypothetical protein
MNLAKNPQAINAGQKQLARLREEKFLGYLPTCIEDLLKATDRGLYSFEDLGTTEIKALELMIKHVGIEQLSARYHFPYGFIKGHLQCRISKAQAAHAAKPGVVLAFKEAQTEQTALAA